MRRLQYITGFLLFLLTRSGSLFAQSLPDLDRYKTDTAKAAVLTALCDSLYRADDYEGMRRIARYSLQVLPGEPAYRARFYLVLGKSYFATLPADTAITYLEQALKSARESKQPGLVSDVLQQLLYTYYSSGNEQKRDATAAELEQLLPSVRDDKARSDIMAVIGNHYNNLSAYDKTIRYLLASLEISRRLDKAGQIKNRENIGVDLLNVGEAFMQMEQPAKGLEYVKEARQYMVYGKDRIPFYYRDMVILLINLDQPQQALVYYDSLTAMNGNDDQAVYGWQCRISMDLPFANYYLLHGQPEQALVYVNRANALAAKWADPYLKASIDYKTGEVYTAFKRYREALALLTAAEPVVRESHKEYSSLLLATAKCYAGLGQWQPAYTYYEKFAYIRDSLQTIAAQKSLADAEAQYRNKEKQQQIESQKAHILYAGRQRSWLIAGLCLAGLVALLLALIYRNKKRSADTLARLNRELEDANNTKLRLFAIISHDLRSPISQVHQYLKLQQLRPELLDERQKQELNDKIRTATGSLLETMEDLLLWSKTQLSSFAAGKEAVDLYDITRQCLELLSLNIDEKQLQLSNQVPVTAVVHSDPNFLQTIIRNLLQNAVKAAPAGTALSVAAGQTNKGWELRIANEGAPFGQQDFEALVSGSNEAPGLSGMGLRLVAELTARIGATVRFAQEDNHTLAILNLPSEA